jgi:hypothetical protein
MRFIATIDGDIRKIMQAAYQDGEKSVTLAMKIVAAQVKSEWRAQVSGAGLGSRLVNSVRSEAYPKGTDSMNAAAMVWTKAPKLIGAFEEGPLIRAKGGRFLAIPTKAAGTYGRYGRKITPLQWQQKNGVKLRFVSPHRGSYLLVADGVRRGTGGGISSEGRRRNPGQSVVIFTLVPQVKLAKRLNLDAGTQRGVADVADQIVSRWK